MQTKSPAFDDFANLMTNAFGAAKGEMEIEALKEQVAKLEKAVKAAKKKS